jgi:hypothetical protein
MPINWEFAMRKFKRANFIPFLLTILLISCEHSLPEIRKPARLGDTIKVIIMEFKDAPQRPGSGASFTPVFTDALLEVSFGKYIPLERKNLPVLLRELELSQTGLTDAQLQGGRLAGADGIIFGEVSQWSEGSFFTQPVVGYTARYVSVATGRTEWSARFSDRISRSAGEQRKPEVVSFEAALIGLNHAQDRLIAVTK